MTAIFTGAGAGLVRSSASELGAAGTLGGAATGRAGEGISVNAATGNLLISRRDEFLTGRSLDVGISRTYNSLAEVHDGDNGDQWQMSTARRVVDENGTLNTAGSTIKRVSGDGSVVTYTYETRGGETGYWTTDGSGTHDFMWKSGGDWYWRDGSSRITERYDADPHNAGEFRIINQTDKDGQSLVFDWGTDNKLDFVKTNNNEYVRYTWSGDKLTSIVTEFVDPKLGTTVTETGTYYSYDGNGRLATVTIDLSPEKAGTSDGDMFTISYLYDSAGRVTQVSQSDGSQTDITYTSGKVTKLTEHVGDGTTRVTQFAYGLNYTNVTAPNLQVTRLDYDGATKMLTKITAPPAYVGAAAQVQTFAYNSANDMVNSIDPQGRETKYSYDDRGNVTVIDRPIGTDVTRVYDGNDNLLREHSTGSYEAAADVNQYTRYAYDVENHMRYRVSADGRVTEYRYDSYGRLYETYEYTADRYSPGSSMIDEATMTAWRDGHADLSQRDITRYSYDARGNMTAALNYGAATATGGPSSSSALEGYSRTWYVYDQEGRLLSRRQEGETGSEQFVYDGMGRLVSSSTASGETTTIYFDDANTSTVMQMASGLTRTMVYNKSGDLVSSTESSVGPHSANLDPSLATDWSIGRATRTADTAIAGKEAYKYSQTATGSYGYTASSTSVAAGETVRYQITLKGDGTTTSHQFGIYGNVDGWGNNATTKSQATILSGSGRLVQEAGGRWKIDGVAIGAVTTIEVTRTFDVAQSSGQYFYVGGIGSNQEAGTSVILTDPIVTKTATDASLAFSATTNNQYDKLGRLRGTQDAFDGRGANYVIYDKAGRKVGVVDPSRRLTEYFYDAANRLIGTTTYSNAISTTRYNQLANPDNTLEMSAIRPTLDDTYDVRDYTIYDANGRVIRTINGEGEVAGFEYDESGRLILTRNYFNKTTLDASWRTDPPTSFNSPGTSNYDAVTRTFYDRDGNVRGVLDGEKFLTEFTYDQSGQKTVETRYALASTRTDWATASFNTLRSGIGTGNANNRYVRSVYNGRGELRFQIDSANYVTQFNYNYAGKLTKTTQHQTALAGSHSDWTIAGVKAGLASNTNDRSVTNYYDTSGRLWRTVESGGLDTRMYFDYAGNLIKTTAGNRTVRAWHDARGNVRFSMDAEGYLTSYLYNEGGQVTHERRYDSKKSASDTTTIQQIAAQATGGYVETSNTYDAQGRVTYSHDAVGNATRYSYNINGTLSFVNRGDNASAHRAQTQYYYDNAGRLVERHDANGESEETITTFTYDGLGNKTEVNDGNGNITRFGYDTRGQVLTQTNGANNQVRYEYNAFGQVAKSWDARNVLVVQNNYNPSGELISSTDALGNITRYTYTQFGEIETVTDARGAVTSFTYDKLGRVVSSTDARNFTESYTYDAYGNRLTVTNKAGGVTTYTYDNLGRATRMVDNNGYDTVTGYDARGNVIETKREVTLGTAESTWLTTTYEYDAANRLTRTTAPAAHGLSAVTTYSYDSRGNTISTTDATGGRTVYFYDDLDRVTIEVSPVGTLTKYEYDKVGNVTNIKVYDTPIAVPSDGAAEENAPAAAKTPAGVYRETIFVYDAANRMTQSIVTGVHNGTYNGSVWSADANNFVTRYEYDANGNVVKTIDPEGNATFAYYDALNRKEHQVDAARYRTTWVYDAVGNVERESRYANQTGAPVVGTTPAVTSSSEDRHTDYTYDLMGNRLTESRRNVAYHNGNGAHLTSNGTTRPHPTVEYSYNGLGQVIEKREAVGELKNYEYDASGRLLKEISDEYHDFDGNPIRPVVSYKYDGLGNLTETRQGLYTTASSDRVTTYGYDNGLLRWTQDAEYNAGNTKAGKRNEFWYDAARRVVIEYSARYDSAGNLAKTPNGVGTTAEGTRYTYDAAGRVLTEVRQVQRSGGTWEDFGPKTTTGYNAFGDVISVKVGTGEAQTNVYDLAGRMVRSNAGDGIWKHFGYDKNGNQTIAIASAGASFSASTTFQQAFNQIANANVNATYTQYDARNMATKVTEEGRQLTATATQNLVTQRGYNPFGEVSYEIDAGGARIDYTYNTMGKVIMVENPTVTYQQEGANGVLAAVTTARPTEHMYYDLSGRLAAQRDANGNLTKMYYLDGTGFGGSQGLVTRITTDDGYSKQTLYDRFGDARVLIDQLNREIGQTFDRNGRLLQTVQVSGLVDNYTYNGNGQQLTHWNSVYGSGNKEITDYDALGRVTSQFAFGGDETRTTYTFAVDASTDAVGNFGGWVQTTSTIADRVSANDTIHAGVVTSDLFGRITARSDAAGNDYTFTYDAAGRMLTEVGTNSSRKTLEYFNTGQIKSLMLGKSAVANTTWKNKTATYGYDALGRLKAEKIVINSGNYRAGYWTNGPDLAPGEPGDPIWVPPSYTTHTYQQQNSEAEYDALGRMTRYIDHASSGVDNVDKRWTYDANGNVRSISTNYRAILTNASQATSTTNQTYWYRYDSMNRLIVSKGIKDASNIVVAGSLGIAMTYDNAGRRITAKHGFGTTEVYTYNTQDLVTNVTIGSVSRVTTSYDNLGRVLGHLERNSSSGLVYERHSITYNNRGQVLAEKSRRLSDNGNGGTDWRYSHTLNFYSAQGYGGPTPTITSSGQVGSSTGSILYATKTKNWLNGSSTPIYGSSNDTNASDDELKYFFSWNDPLGTGGPRETKKERVQQYGNTKTETLYDDQGHIYYVTFDRYSSGGSYSGTSFVNYETDMSGQVTYRYQAGTGSGGSGTYAPINERYYRFGGQAMGELGNDGTDNVDYTTTIARRDDNGNGYYRGGATTGTQYADFDINHVTMAAAAGSTGGGYTARGGETLQSIARQVWGDSQLWYKIAEANGLSANTTLSAGQTIRLPAGGLSNTHNASSIKPYDPADALGDTSPGTIKPPAQGKKGCGIVGAILLAVIAVAVAIVLPTLVPALAPAAFGGGALGTAISGAIGAAAGSVVSQGVGVATGIQDKFSFKGVALAAIGGAVGGALKGFDVFKAGALGGATNAVNDFARGVISSTATQGIAVATGLQEKFDFVGVAVAGVGAVAGGAIGRGLESNSGIFGVRAASGSFGHTLATGAASGLSGAATRSALEGSSFGRNLVAAVPDVIGQAVGGAIGGAVSNALARRRAISGATSSLLSGIADSRGIYGAEREAFFKAHYNPVRDSVKARLANEPGSAGQMFEALGAAYGVDTNALLNGTGGIQFVGSSGNPIQLVSLGMSAGIGLEREYTIEPLWVPLNVSEEVFREYDAAYKEIEYVARNQGWVHADDRAIRFLDHAALGLSFLTKHAAAEFSAFVENNTLLRNALNFIETSSELIRSLPVIGDALNAVDAGLEYANQRLSELYQVRGYSATTAGHLADGAMLVGEVAVGGGIAGLLTKVARFATRINQRDRRDEDIGGYGPRRPGWNPPVGFTAESFRDLGVLFRDRIDGAGLGDDFVIMGSRARGNARPDSDFDFGIRVPGDQFDRLIAERFGAPNSGSAKERTMLRSIRDGRIQTGEAGLRPLRRDVASQLGVDQSLVQISIIRQDGVFDNGPQTQLPYGN